MHKGLARRSLFVVAASLSVGAAGCGVSGGGTSQQLSAGLAPQVQSAGAVTEAAEATAAVSSEKVSITVSTESTSGGPSLSITSNGEVDAANQRAHLTADLAGSKDARGGLTEIETVYDGDTIYLKSPFTSLLGDKPWVKLTSPKLADAVGSLAGSVQPDPGALLSFLEGAGGSVEEIGAEEVRGVPTTHVSVQIDPAKVADQVPADRRKQLDEQLDGLGVALSDLPTVPADVWLDADGYVRRLSVVFDLSKLSTLHPGGSSSEGKGDAVAGTVTATVELYDFNEPVRITVPAPTEVSEIDPSKLGLGD